MDGSDAVLIFWIVFGAITGGWGIWTTFFDGGGGPTGFGGDGSSGTSL